MAFDGTFCDHSHHVSHHLSPWRSEGMGVKANQSRSLGPEAKCSWKVGYMLHEKNHTSLQRTPYFGPMAIIWFLCRTLDNSWHACVLSYALVPVFSSYSPGLPTAAGEDFSKPGWAKIDLMLGWSWIGVKGRFKIYLSIYIYIYRKIYRCINIWV